MFASVHHPSGTAEQHLGFTLAAAAVLPPAARSELLAAISEKSSSRAVVTTRPGGEVIVGDAATAVYAISCSSPSAHPSFSTLSSLYSWLAWASAYDANSAAAIKVLEEHLKLAGCGLLSEPLEGAEASLADYVVCQRIATWKGESSELVAGYVSGAKAASQVLDSVLSAGDAEAARWKALEERQVKLLEAIGALEAKVAAGTANTGAGAVTSTGLPGDPPVRQVEQTVSEVWTRIDGLCKEMGMTKHAFKRAPPEYYDCSLQWRQALLGAPSIHQLCKSIVFVNKKAPKDVVDCSNPRMSKYYCAIVQYTARINTAELERYVKSLNPGVAKRKFHFRLVKDDQSAVLTGYGHNAVTPIGMATPIPIVLDAALTKLPQGNFWLGAGEVDLKIRVDANEFVAATNCFVANFTEPNPDYADLP
ncbi:YbaK/prolyl-tRNA synthetase associated domain-containing protein [Thecamonas trahens ATCC 50062]|uniref:YbaK/prolyl-tRNA synthetase associated domain-containing protein n=1 Tax=Thecamonas trahens ATCC 50062 TaxID=461836 RepID=A0A0L0DWM8_THETB|nr:YbaK/prolyl-tRNA synthetase associated domain-containing protein [Thecamonas trahens ATCC 50062]KNC56501.1 YbaK/prolyl-tRNA synthetase associated domain-containing protein [Thecamonas trahens ATCC 50062]|eukprot:XP_013752624.1 YbaK/prolyl-tRNA synthetase associated domain-containing protein [Thecamonas trahens ATCC 50062]